MSQYEERLQQDLERIRDAVVAVAHLAQQAFAASIQTMLERDDTRAYSIVLGDLKINRDIRELDRQCHKFIARHLPSAGHLRFVSSVMRINIEIERIGDYAVTVARESVRLACPLPANIAAHLRQMGEQGYRMFGQAIDAFAIGSADKARATISMATQFDTTFDEVFADLVTAGENDTLPLADLFALLATFNRVERVSDQAKNICEEIIFAQTGETKAPKVYRIAFLDAGNSCASVMAEQIAAKAYPDSGRYCSAGWEPDAALEPGFELFMNRRGHAVEGYRPKALADAIESLDDLHVIVSLQGDPRPRIGQLPYHTALQVWDVGPLATAGLDRERADAITDRAYKEIALRVEELITSLRGSEAS